ncbi:unnamed protein product [Penicillium olsonii]|nr:unnamed protein product [Penicillium olsonii]CAG7925853.1 unnamed protein product [Penicillium olsonii]
MPGLLNLPSEMLARTFSYVNQSSLKSLRQSCRFTSHLATDQLYRTVRLQPGKKSQNALQEILNNHSLRGVPRKIYIDTVDENIGYSSDSPDNDFLHYQEFPQMPQFRFKAMHQFFSLLESLPQPIQDLGIRNLQADNPKDPKILANMEKVLSGLLSLRLSITSETNDAAPEHDLENPEIRKFCKELPSTWLSPAAPSLQHLSLSSREYSGFYPRLDLSNLFFPHLKTLSLGNFCFFHDDQIDWILKHGDTLEEIYLDDCAILYGFRMMDENVDACALSRDAFVRRNDDYSLYGSFDKRWHDIFDLFAEKLPKLRHFRIGRSQWYPDVPFEQEMDIKVGLYYNRYMCCYDGTGPSPYMEGEKPENVTYLEPGWSLAPQCDDEDRAALRRLLAKLGQSAQESHFGSDNSRVVDLIQTR